MFFVTQAYLLMGIFSLCCIAMEENKCLALTLRTVKDFHQERGECFVERICL